MIRASVFVGISLDGFLARPHGELDWLPGAEGTELPEDHGYDAFLATVDVIVIGSGTYEKVLPYPTWPYGAMPVRVLTTRPLARPASGGVPTTVEAMAGPPAAILAALERQGFRHAYVDGGKTIQAFLAAGLVHKLTLTRVPVLIGEGIPLFGPLPHDIALTHVRTRVIGSGMVQSEYEVASP